VTNGDECREFVLDRRSVQRAFDRAACDYDRSAVLQTRVRNELLERLDLVRLEPVVVIDLGAGTGHASATLAKRYRSSRVVAVDRRRHARAGRRQRSLLRRFDGSARTPRGCRFATRASISCSAT
jgi:malonyl-CoA O-methyltransferase